MSRRALVVASTFGHIANFHLPYIVGLKEAGFELHVACGGEKINIPGAKRFVELPLEKRMLSMKNLKTVKILHRLYRESDYKLIIMHTSLAAFYARLALAGMRHRPKTVNVVHGYLFDERSRGIKPVLLKTAECMLAPLTDCALTMNAYDLRWAREKRVARHVRFIPGMGVDEEKLRGKATRNEYGLSDDDFVLIYPAEFSKRKNQELLIRALPHLPEKVKLVLPGDGDRLDMCRMLAEKMGVSDRVVFTNYVPNIASLLGISDAAVSASRSEGLPFNVAEAMLCELPVVVSRVKGNIELVEDGVNGFLYEYNDLNGFVKAVKRLIDNPAMRQNMGTRGREKAAKYTLEHVYPLVMGEYLSEASYNESKQWILRETSCTGRNE